MVNLGDYPGDFRLLSGEWENTVQNLESPGLPGELTALRIEFEIRRTEIDFIGPLWLSAGVVCCLPPIFKPSLGRREKLPQKVGRRKIYLVYMFLPHLYRLASESVCNKRRLQTCRLKVNNVVKCFDPIPKL